MVWNDKAHQVVNNAASSEVALAKFCVLQVKFDISICTENILCSKVRHIKMSDVIALAVTEKCRTLTAIYNILQDIDYKCKYLFPVTTLRTHSPHTVEHFAFTFNVPRDEKQNCGSVSRPSSGNWWNWQYYHDSHRETIFSQNQWHHGQRILVLISPWKGQICLSEVPLPFFDFLKTFKLNHKSPFPSVYQTAPARHSWRSLSYSPAEIRWFMLNSVCSSNLNKKPRCGFDSFWHFKKVCLEKRLINMKNTNTVFATSKTLHNNASLDRFMYFFIWFCFGGFHVFHFYINSMLISCANASAWLSGDHLCCKKKKKTAFTLNC